MIKDVYILVSMMEFLICDVAQGLKGDPPILLKGDPPILLKGDPLSESVTIQGK